MLSAFRRVELRRVSRFARDGCDCRRPAGECVSVFSSLGLGRRCAAVGRRRAVFDGRCGACARAVDIRPRNRVAALRRVGDQIFV